MSEDRAATEEHFDPQKAAKNFLDRADELIARIEKDNRSLAANVVRAELEERARKRGGGE
jgi:hypothetical protein